MERKRYKFNIIDGVIIIVLAAVLAAIGYNLYKDRLTGGETADIRYVIEVDNVREELCDKVIEGQLAYSESTGQIIGTVSVTEDRAATIVSYGTDGGTVNEVPGMRVMYITLTANASVTDEGYVSGGETVRTGSKIAVMLPDFYCEGTCISVTPEG
jgi:hypothetical protein